MATIINNPADTTPVVASDSGAGIVVGVIVALVLIVLFVMYVVPSFRGADTYTPADTTGGASANLNVTLPAGNNTTPATGGATQ